MNLKKKSFTETTLSNAWSGTTFIAFTGHQEAADYRLKTLDIDQKHNLCQAVYILFAFWRYPRVVIEGTAVFVLGLTL